MAHFVHSDLAASGSFVSSSSVLNGIHHATRFAALSNAVDIPTDCPQRERRGWLVSVQQAAVCKLFYTTCQNDSAVQPHTTRTVQLQLHAHRTQLTRI